jgi:hypothetical protein
MSAAVAHKHLDFALVLQYMYEGRAEFTPQNCIAILAMANYYLVCLHTHPFVLPDTVTRTR